MMIRRTIAFCCCAVLFSGCSNYRSPIRDVPCNADLPPAISLKVCDEQEEGSYDLSAPLTLVQLLDIALENNPLTRKTWWNARRASACLGVAKSALYPFLDARGKIRHSQDVSNSDSSTKCSNNFNIELSLSYLLMDFGHTDANIAAACAALASADWLNDWAIQKVLFETTAAYYEVANARDILQALKESLSDSEKALELADQLYEAGLKSETDLYTSKSAVAKISMEITQQKAQLEIQRGRLATAAGLPADLHVRIEAPPKEPPVLETQEGMKTLLEQADMFRGDLMAKRADVEQKQYDWMRAVKADWPKFRILGDTGWKDQFQDHRKGYSYCAALAVETPIFHGFEFTYNRRFAYANLQASYEELRQLELDIALEVLTYSERFQAANDLLQLSSEYLEYSQKSYNSSLDSYQAGMLSIFDLLDAERDLSDARVRFAAARTQWYVSMAQLSYATGTIRQSMEAQ